MKKTIAALVIAFAFLPVFAHADTLTDEQLEAEIAVLQAQVADLINQLAQLQSNMTDNQQDQGEQTFGGTEEQPAFDVSLDVSTKPEDGQAIFTIDGDFGIADIDIVLPDGKSNGAISWPVNGDHTLVADWFAPGDYTYTATVYENKNREGAKAVKTGSFTI